MRLKDCVGVAAFGDKRATEETVSRLTRLFGDLFHPLDSVVEVALRNPNATYHIPTALLNLGRIEDAEEWTFADLATPGVIRVIEAMDSERIAVGRACGIRLPSFADRLVDYYNVTGDDLQTLIPRAYGADSTLAAPKDLKHRFFWEDIPFIMAPFISLAELLGVEVPVTRSLMELGATVLGPELLNDAAGVTAADMKALGLAAEVPGTYSIVED